MSKAEIRKPGALPLALPGFEKINRYWDPMHNMCAAKILPGEYYVTCESEIVVTVLGSCISVCVRDPVAGVGGMNHFMLPVRQHKSVGSWSVDSSQEQAMRYGDSAMKRLLNEILSHGGRRENLEAKIFGGGRIIEQMTDIGASNIDFIHKYVKSIGLRLVNEDTGGIYPRKVYYFLQEGKVRVKKLRTLHNDTIIQREVSYLEQLDESVDSGD